MQVNYYWDYIQKKINPEADSSAHEIVSENSLVDLRKRIQVVTQNVDQDGDVESK